MELVDGRTLEAELVDRGPFDADELVRVASDLCAALAAVHGAGLVHRDVKATNVIREPTGRLVLGDFGTGLTADASADRRTGLIGTPVYIAPEIYARAAATASSDLYSLGVLLFHLATGRFPVTGRSMHEIRAAHQASARAALAVLRPDLPARLCNANERLLEADPARRFPSADDVRHAIARLVDDGRRQRVVLAAIAVIAAAGVAAGGIWLLSPGQTEGPAQPAFVHLHPELQATMIFRGAAFERRLIACQNSQQGAVAVCDLTRGTVRVLRERTGDSSNPFGRNQLLLSSDGTRVAYQWTVGRGPGQTVSVNVIGANGGRSVELHRDEAASQFYMHRWLSDSSALLVSKLDGEFRRLFLLPVDGGPPVDVWRLPRGHDQALDLSPDRTALVTVRLVPPGDTSLVVINLATGEETTIVAETPNMNWPLWTPDGRAIVFTSIRSGSVLMRQAISARAPLGPATVVWRFGRGEVRLIAFGADGSLFAMHKPGSRTVYVAPIDLANGRIGSARLLDPTDAEDTIGADWSPDGSRVAYIRGAVGVSARGFNGTVVIRRIGEGIEQEISLPNGLPQNVTQARWAPEGRRLAVVHGDGTAEGNALDVIDLATRERSNIVSGPPYVNPRWDVSEHSLLYREGPAIVRRNLTTGATTVAYRAEGLGIQWNGGFDVSKTDGALAILATRRGVDGCVVRIADASGAVVDRHVFGEDCWAIAWSRDGSKILVSTLPNAIRGNLWSLDRAGGDPVLLPIEAPQFHTLSLDPTDGRLLFTTGNPRFTMGMVTDLGETQR
jgi:Tol biopolymer transport system component